MKTWKHCTYVGFFSAILALALLNSCLTFIDDDLIILRNNSSFDLKIYFEFENKNMEIDLKKDNTYSFILSSAESKLPFGAAVGAPDWYDSVIAKRIIFSDLHRNEVIKNIDNVSIYKIRDSSNKPNGNRQEFQLIITDELLFENK